MSWLEFIEKIVGYITWPATVITILLILRPHLSGIFTALKSLKLPGGGEVELFEHFEKAREKAEAAELPVPEKTSVSDAERDKFLRMAEDFPQAAIMQTWIELEKEIVDLAGDYTQRTPRIGPTYTPRPHTVGSALRELRIHEVIDPATAEVITGLSRIRNDVVHARKEAVTPGEALEFRGLARGVIDKLRQIERPTS